MPNSVRERLNNLLADDCFKYSSCFGDKGKQIDCRKECEHMKRLSKEIILAISEEVGKMRKTIKLCGKGYESCEVCPYSNTGCDDKKYYFKVLSDIQDKLKE